MSQVRATETQRKLRAGIVGGGVGSFIGTVHRIAAQLDNQAEVVAGAMSADPKKAAESAKASFVPRSYHSFQEMAELESTLPDGIDFVMITVPNYLHFPVAKAFLEQGISVICDKPLASTLEDDANILLRLEGGGKGILTCSQVAAGEENALSIRIYGSKAGLAWHQMEPNSLTYKLPGQPIQILRTGQPYMSEEAKQSTRLPAGHPEGFYEAFANIYKLAIEDIRRLQAGQKPLAGYPSIYDGLRGMNFVHKTIESSKKGSIWVNMS